MQVIQATALHPLSISPSAVYKSYRLQLCALCSSHQLLYATHTVYNSAPYVHLTRCCMQVIPATALRPLSITPAAVCKSYRLQLNLLCPSNQLMCAVLTGRSSAHSVHLTSCCMHVIQATALRSQCISPAAVCMLCRLQLSLSISPSAVCKSYGKQLYALCPSHQLLYASHIALRPLSISLAAVCRSYMLHLYALCHLNICCVKVIHATALRPLSISPDDVCKSNRPQLHALCLSRQLLYSSRTALRLCSSCPLLYACHTGYISTPSFHLNSCCMQVIQAIAHQLLCESNTGYSSAPSVHLTGGCVQVVQATALRPQSISPAAVCKPYRLQLYARCPFHQLLCASHTALCPLSISPATVCKSYTLQRYALFLSHQLLYESHTSYTTMPSVHLTSCCRQVNQLCAV